MTQAVLPAASDPRAHPATAQSACAGGPAAPRLVSLDQFRGYTVLGMFLVNFVGSYELIRSQLPLLKHHNTYCSYADTIMPHFLFAVGFAYRMTFLRRRRRVGPREAYWHAWQRNLGLLLVAFIVHNLDGRYETWAQLSETGIWGVLSTAFQRSFFQTLAHIAVTSIWIMPVVGASPGVRVAYAAGSGILFHVLSEYGYYSWEMTRPGIDGGPLGFLGWSIPALLGSLAYDMLTAARPLVVTRMIGWSVAVMVFAYGLSCLNLVTDPNTVAAGSSWQAYLVEPPFVPPTRPVNIWTMSQRAGAISYVTFGAGFSLFLYALFVLACDRGGVQIGIFRTLGMNALVGYILHDLVNAAVKPFVPKDSPLWYVFAGFGVSLAICYVFLRHLERHRLFLKL